MLYIYENYVVKTAKGGNFEVTLNFGDEDSEAKVIVNKDIEKFVSENAEIEMVAIIIAIIKFARIYSRKEDGREKIGKDITRTEEFETKFLKVINTFPFEYLEEKFNGLKYSEILTIFNWDVPSIIEYFN